MNGTSPPRGLLSAEITRLKREGELAWLRDLPAQLPQQALLDLERAFKAFFAKRSGYPRFRRKRVQRASFRLPQHVRVDGNRVHIPRIGWVRARVSRYPGPDLGSATISRTADGRWFAAINERLACPPSDPTRTRLWQASTSASSISWFATTGFGPQLLASLDETARQFGAPTGVSLERSQAAVGEGVLNVSLLADTLGSRIDAKISCTS